MLKRANVTRKEFSMIEKDFTSRIDGLINDYEGGESNSKELRDGILDTLIELVSKVSPFEARVSPMLADKKEELLNFKQKLYKAQANMLKEFKPKEHQVILDFIATINEKDLEQ